MSSRRAALRQLERIERDQAYIGQLEGSDADAPLDARTRRQVKEYVAGVTRWRRWLDFVLAAFYHGDFDEMERPLQIILRLGLYDLLFLRTPTHAAVHENVELAKREVRPGAAGLVNGVLRTIDRQRDDLPTPDTGDPAEDLAIRQSHPTWMVRRWMARYGAEATQELLAWNNRRPVHGVRINTLATSVAAFQTQLDAHDVAWTASPYLDDFVRVKGLQPVIAAGWMDAGQCAVQDESAGLVVRVLDPKPGETVIDACAAPGGKTIYAALRMQAQGTIHAVDANEARLRLVTEGAAAHGVDGMVHPVGADLREWARADDAPQADRVLLDAPCSGLGVLAKRADLRWQRSPADLDELTTLQDELLDAAARLVRPGGLLVYSTCTIEPEENQRRVAAFRERDGRFALESVKGTVPDTTVTAEGVFTTLPHEHGVDGAFAARLRRTDRV
ncbi:MAG: 16S rRNA (cytosine(967)-C(5))-methyltransferase RsmB [Bacteroidetes bacterium]|jgi:16S rRNA (cytosine967-C5)-methyltransferase|nr:16S rRNA (cytosine(967)-C(5))-methyltransferase RsmB [Bacteroidota bacterium]